jgi:hypothetical protein
MYLTWWYQSNTLAGIESTVISGLVPLLRFSIPVLVLLTHLGPSKMLNKLGGGGKHKCPEDRQTLD